MYAHASLIQDGFYQKGIQVEHSLPLTLLPSLAYKELFYACVAEEVSRHQG